MNKPSEFILNYDKNGDCRVTPDELKAGSAPKQQAPAGQKGGRFH